jgi:Sulfotransferase family
MSANVHLPNFFIVGAPKAGTTSLHAYLRQHEQIYMSPIKEPNFFASELRPENFSSVAQSQIVRDREALQTYLEGDMRQQRFGALVSSWEDYKRLFRNVTSEIAIGEATPCYLWSATAPGNIAARIPDAKIIMILRNPVERAFSQYLHMVVAGATRDSFGDLINASLLSSCRKFGPLWPFLEFGQYHDQVARYLNLFSRPQIHISLYEDLQRTPASLVSSLFSFLGVDAKFEADVTQRHLEPRIPRYPGAARLLRRTGMWALLRRLIPESSMPKVRSLAIRPRDTLHIGPEERAVLIDYYQRDIEKLAQLIGRDLSPWVIRRRESVLP